MSFAHHIEVFTVQPFPVQADGIDVQVCWLDEIEWVERNLLEVSQDVDAIRSRIKEKEDILIKGMDCQFRAGLYDIKKLPAIVIDEKYVAYGACSVSKVLEILNDVDNPNA